jgi:hypothetical protein
MRLRTVAALSFVLTYLFFIDYAFQALRQGRFPEWDPTIYCGLSFAGNVQAALFYPPAWLMFLFSAGRDHVAFAALEIVVFLHVWLAFVLCYGWLRANGLRAVSSAIGAGAFAFSGYMMLQLQHFGVVAGYAWMPLGLWGIDDASRRRDWRPLWKLAVASAMCLLAGYPPTWFVFAVCAFVYAVCRPRPFRTGIGAAGALAFSMLLAAVQLFPAIETSAMKVFEPRYGSGFRDPAFYTSYFVPNYFDFGFHVDRFTNPGREYLYLGAAAIFGLICAVRAPVRKVAPAGAMLAVSLIGLTNPFDLVARVAGTSRLLVQICRDWYFLAGVTLAVAALAAAGVNAFLDSPLADGRGSVQNRTLRLTAPAAALLGIWAVVLLVEWRLDSFRAGPRAILEPAVMLALIWVALNALRSESGRRRVAIATMLLIGIAVEYLAFGVTKRFNAWPGKAPRPQLLAGADPSVLNELHANAVYRLVLDETAGFPLSLRSFGLTTPQGFDPLITTQYRDAVAKIAHFRTNWLIDFDPGNTAALRLLGVRYYITTAGGPRLDELRQSSAYRSLEPQEGFYRVFELIDPSPPYACQSCDARLVRWTPERREFLVHAKGEARLALIEQRFPGWRVTVDGATAPLEGYRGAFQSVRVAAGEHRVAFTYRSEALRAGAVVTALALAGLMLLMFGHPGGLRGRRRLRACPTGRIHDHGNPANRSGVIHLKTAKRMIA